MTSGNNNLTIRTVVGTGERYPGARATMHARNPFVRVTRGNRLSPHHICGGWTLPLGSSPRLPAMESRVTPATVAPPPRP